MSQEKNSEQNHRMLRQSAALRRNQWTEKETSELFEGNVRKRSKNLDDEYRAMEICTIPNHDSFMDNSVAIHSAGPMNAKCSFCQSLNFECERLSDNSFKYCCSNGTVILPESQQFPSLLIRLLSDQEHYQFKENILSYNSLLSFVTSSAEIDNLPINNRSDLFNVHGQIYHSWSDKHSDMEHSQTFVIDSQFDNLNPINKSILSELSKIIEQNNVYTECFRNLFEEIDETVISNVNLNFLREQHKDKRRYNFSTIDEVAMVFETEDGESPCERNFRVYPRNPEESSDFLDLQSAALNPMSYAIFFPSGDDGRSQNNGITTSQWKIAQMALRADSFNPILCGGKLFQKWAIESYLQAEANEFNEVRNSKKGLRAEPYRDLLDHLHSQADGRRITVGRKFVHRSLFKESKTEMDTKCQDAITIVGQPDLFITFTCNKNWPEIQSNLLYDQRPIDRPDLIVRVFSIKLAALLKDITENGVFGRVKAYVYTIEFQKRGLPHAHILLTLHDNDKIDTAQKVDRYICAELPDRDTEPALYETVLQMMTHRPCGVQAPKAACMEKGRCSKNFPKSFQEFTIADIEGYPLYRRRCAQSDNGWIVPYNKYLSRKYTAHINVECCKNVKNFENLFEYIFKGYDCATVQLSERATFDTRYVCAPEAIWRMLDNPMHGRSHEVVRLVVHLPNEQIVYFNEGYEEEAETKAANKFTQLTAWFNLNQFDANARQYLYTEVPMHYEFDKRASLWQKRDHRTDKIVSRIASVSPMNEELFHLRLLLHHVRGAQSFDDLKTVNDSFKLTAIDLDLVDEDDETNRCLQEACGRAMPKELRDLFALICLFNLPTNPANLYNKFKDFLIEDYIRDNPRDVAESKALSDFDLTFQMRGKKCSDFHLANSKEVTNSEEIFDAQKEAQEAQLLKETLNPLQRLIFDEIVATADNEALESKFFFVDGPGGSGKTYLYNTLTRFFRGRGQSVEVFAMTGIAATLLRGGRTAHKGFMLPVPINGKSVSKMKIPSPESKKLLNAALLIIDEATMLTAQMLKIIDSLLKDITNNKRPFGGKLLVLGGDFRQIGPIVKSSVATNISEKPLKKSILWRFVEKRTLVTNMRTMGQSEFNEWVLKVGQGEVVSDVPGLIEIPQQMIETGDIVRAVFGNKLTVHTDQGISDASGKVILTTTNEAVTELNNRILKLIEGDAKEYQNNNSEPLLLKIGAFIMLNRNIDCRRGLINGTRLVVRGLWDDVIDAEILTGSHRGDRTFIPRIVINNKQKIRQFPISLAFAMTINKSQGQSFDHVGVVLPRPVFSHGQLYVALTRARSHSNMRIRIEESTDQGLRLPDGRTFTKNIVQKDILNL